MNHEHAVKARVTRFHLRVALNIHPVQLNRVIAVWKTKKKIFRD